jgi:hypothetical protein
MALEIRARGRSGELLHLGPDQLRLFMKYSPVDGDGWVQLLSLFEGLVIEARSTAEEEAPSDWLETANPAAMAAELDKLTGLLDLEFYVKDRVLYCQADRCPCQTWDNDLPIRSQRLTLRQLAETIQRHQAEEKRG